jgi:hypothetical protein
MEINPECPEKEKLLAALQSARERLQKLSVRRFEAANAGLLQEVELLDGLRRRELDLTGNLDYAYRQHVLEHGC